MQDLNNSPARIEVGSYQADILRGGTIEKFWYYVIRRKDSNEIIDLAKFEDREQAMEAARQVLARVSEQSAAS